MTPRGWIYVLVNTSLQGLVKIGFSTKDPAIRVKELSSTGVPREFEIAYEALVENPRDLEQRVHASLRSHHENKEFFRTSPECAVATIRAVASEIGVNLQLERNILHGGPTNSFPPSEPSVASPSPRRILAPSKIRVRGEIDKHNLRKARVAQASASQPKKSCPHCGSEKVPSPSGYCQSCFGRYRSDA